MGAKFNELRRERSMLEAKNTEAVSNKHSLIEAIKCSRHIWLIPNAESKLEIAFMVSRQLNSSFNKGSCRQTNINDMPKLRSSHRLCKSKLIKYQVKETSDTLSSLVEFYIFVLRSWERLWSILLALLAFSAALELLVLLAQRHLITIEHTSGKKLLRGEFFQLCKSLANARFEKAIIAAVSDDLDLYAGCGDRHKQ